MDGYTLAWFVIGVMAIGGGFSLWQLTRTMRWQGGRLCLVAGVMLFFCLPAPIPQVSGGYAPAFVIAIFEWLFQANGRPGTSFGILVLSLAALLVFAAVSFYRYWRQTTTNAAE